MSRQFSPRTFLRQVPNQLLKEFFDRRKQLTDVYWYLQRETEIELVYGAWQALPQPQRVEVERIFQIVDELACEAGVKALIEEGQFQGIDFASELEGCEGFHHKAMHTYLHRPRIF